MATHTGHTGGVHIFLDDDDYAEESSAGLRIIPGTQTRTCMEAHDKENVMPLKYDRKDVYLKCDRKELRPPLRDITPVALQRSSVPRWNNKPQTDAAAPIISCRGRVNSLTHAAPVSLAVPVSRCRANSIATDTAAEIGPARPYTSGALDHTLASSSVPRQRATSLLSVR